MTTDYNSFENQMIYNGEQIKRFRKRQLRFRLLIRRSYKWINFVKSFA